jgi:hypothetical protein
MIHITGMRLGSNELNVLLGSVKVKLRSFSKMVLITAYFLPFAQAEERKRGTRLCENEECFAQRPDDLHYRHFH